MRVFRCSGVQVFRHARLAISASFTLPALLSLCIVGQASVPVPPIGRQGRLPYYDGGVGQASKTDLRFEIGDLRSGSFSTLKSQVSSLNDPASLAAIAAGEPPLQVILARQGYTIDTVKDEIRAQRFVKAGKGPVTHRPIAAYGLRAVCSSGWYPAPAAATESPDTPPPQKRLLWQVDAPYNKQAFPPTMKGGVTKFDPGDMPFGLWVSTAGFKDETVCTEDALQVFVPRFKPDDRHKAHVFPAKRHGKVIPNTYIIGWEYSTNNDDQDMVTLVRNVKPTP